MHVVGRAPAGIGGDVVDGVGIYPNQDKELVCQTIEEQLEKTEKILIVISKAILVLALPYIQVFPSSICHSWA